MNRTSAFLALICFCGIVRAQKPLSQDEALKQMYGNYDISTRTAKLPCSDAQRVENSKSPGSWWPCYQDKSTVTVEIILMATVPKFTDSKQKSEEVYLVTSAVPAHAASGFDCHSCEPAIGVAQFVWQDQGWKLENGNSIVGFYGSWGNPPTLNLVAIGPSHYGVMLSDDFGGQGYMSGSKWLLAAVGNTVAEVWRIQDEQDDFGAYDPRGVDGPSIRYRSVAAIRFGCILDESCGNGNGYFDLEVISRGSDESGATASLKAENWTAVYQFKDGKYKLVRHQDFIESKAGPSPKSRLP